MGYGAGDPPDVDLGNGIGGWYVTVGDHRAGGLIIDHGDGCSSAILFDLPGIREAHPGRDVWTLHSRDPLHVEPSIMRAGDKNDTDHDHHGWIRAGRWEPA